MHQVHIYVQISGQGCFTGKMQFVCDSLLVCSTIPSWMSHLIATNRSHGALDPVDLYELLPEYQSKKLTDNLENNWLDEKKRSPRNPSLIRATIRTMGCKPVLAGLLLIPWVCIASFFPKAYHRLNIQMLCCIAQPLLLTFLMDFFEPCSTMSVKHAWFLTFACIVTPLLSSFFLNYVSQVKQGILS